MLQAEAIWKKLKMNLSFIVSTYKNRVWHCHILLIEQPIFIFSCECGAVMWILRWKHKWWTCLLSLPRIFPIHLHTALNHLNTRTPGGLISAPPPLRFFADNAKNGGAQRRRALYTCSFIFSTHCLKIFGPGSCQVMSPGHVKWRHLKTQFSNFDTLPQSQLWTQRFQTFRSWWGE